MHVTCSIVKCKSTTQTVGKSSVAGRRCDTRTCAARNMRALHFSIAQRFALFKYAIVSLIKVIPCNRSNHRKWLRALHWQRSRRQVVWVRRRRGGGGALSMTDEWLNERTFYSRKHDPENSQMNIEHINRLGDSLMCVCVLVAPSH